MLNVQKTLQCQGALKFCPHMGSVFLLCVIRLNIPNNCVCSPGCVFYWNIAAEQNCWLTFRLNLICIKAYN